MPAFACFLAHASSALNGFVGLPFLVTMLVSNSLPYLGGGASRYWVICLTRGLRSAIWNDSVRNFARWEAGFLYGPLAMYPYSVRWTSSALPPRVVSFFCL